MKQTIFSIMIFLACFSTASAQQYPLFSNYLTNSFGFNPALAGSTPYVDTRLTYRSQWVGIGGQPITSILSMHGKSDKYKFGYGGYIFSDNAGSLKRVGGTGAISYTERLDHKTELTLGVSGGYYSFRVKGDVKTTNGSTDVTVFDGQKGAWVPDFNIGAYLKSGRFYLGVSVPQIWQRKINFTANDTNKLVRHYYSTIGYIIPLNDKIEVEPSALLKFLPGAPFQFDASARVIFNKVFWVGGSYRSNDAAVGMMGIDYKSLSLSYAYDFTTSSLNTVSSGSHEIVLGYKFGGAKPDRDKDGVLDKDDKCPDVPGPKENFGCPTEKKDDPDGDNDGDGIKNKEDKCPEEKGPRSNMGCPVGDRDKDGVADDEDKCPDVPGLVNNHGCPFSDRDGDGVPDDLDKCPDTPGSLATNGCPSDDRDNDGIADGLDKCPNTFGTKDNGGCPTPTSAENDALSLGIKNIYFETDKWDIINSSKSFLDKLAEVMVNHGDWKLRIAGHADARGSDEHNIILSRNRSYAVRDYLVSKGVKTKQLITEYYGEMNPEADNTTPEGQQLNRRVNMGFVFE